jgi:hypothetical protein
MDAQDIADQQRSVRLPRRRDDPFGDFSQNTCALAASASSAIGA